jgi:hypothetical protein
MAPRSSAGGAAKGGGLSCATTATKCSASRASCATSAPRPSRRSSAASTGAASFANRSSSAFLSANLRSSETPSPLQTGSQLRADTLLAQENHVKPGTIIPSHRSAKHGTKIQEKII